MYKTTHIKYILGLLLLNSIFITGLSAEILNATHWVIKPGDSLYKIARDIFPGDTKQQALLRKQLVEQNPVIFKNGANNISVGDQLKLPDFAIKQQQPAAIVEIAPEPEIPEVITSEPALISVADTKNKASTNPVPLSTPDSEDIIGKVVINIGSLSAKNRGATRELKRRSNIYRGDTISTGGRSHTQIRLKDGALLSLRPYTDIRIAEYRYNGQQDGSERSFFELLKGGFRTITGAIGHKNKQNYRVKTSVATIGIRGTHYSLVLCQQQSCSGEDTGEVEDGLYGGVADGSIVIENESGIHRFSNDQFFKLTSATTAPVEFLYPPAILKHGSAKLADAGKATQQQAENNASQRVKSQPRRLPVIFEPNQPDFGQRPKIPVKDLNAPPIAEFQPETAPDGAGMLVGFNQLDTTGTIGGGAGSITVSPGNNNQIFLSPNRQPIAAGGSLTDTATGTITQYEFVIATPNGTPATLVPSSVGGSAALGVNWGRWNGDFAVLENGTRLNTKDDFHFIYSENITSPSQLANLGGIKGASTVYTSVAGTNPTDAVGNVGTTFASVYMSVDFITQEMTYYDVSASVMTPAGSVTYQAFTTNPEPLLNLENGFSLTGTACASGACAGDASVLFVGPEANGAITSYQINDLNGSSGVTGTALLTDGQLPF